MGPQINVIGSFFPSWMLCAAIGIVVALIARQVFLRIGVDPVVVKLSTVNGPVTVNER